MKHVAGTELDRKMGEIFGANMARGLTEHEILTKMLGQQSNENAKSDDEIWEFISDSISKNVLLVPNNLPILVLDESSVIGKPSFSVLHPIPIVNSQKVTESLEQTRWLKHPKVLSLSKVGHYVLEVVIYVTGKSSN